VTTLDISLLPWQQEVLNNLRLNGGEREDGDDRDRFSVVAAGRRTGKSHLAAVSLFLSALDDRPGKTVYVAPTAPMARDILWPTLFDMGGELITNSNVNNLDITLVNGSKIGLRGSDRPDTLRGLSIKHLVLDEAAFVKEGLYETVLRPALSDRMGSALFIGTPAGRNWFYDLFMGAHGGDLYDHRAWHFTSYDNPTIPPSEIDHAKRTLPSHAFHQEYMASFDATESQHFSRDQFDIVDDIPRNPNGNICVSGDHYIACDLAGFRGNGPRRDKTRDSSAIAIVYVTDDGHWYVRDIITGQWTLNETAQKIFRAVEKYQPISVGIEKGISKQAIMDPLADIMRRTHRVFNIRELSHGNQNKEARIMFALQGKAEHGLLHLCDGPYVEKFMDEALQFPSRLVHDDMIDALSYVDQLAKTSYAGNIEIDTWEALDAAAGY
jgi:predicted phage terminase large subunit-like protein